MQFVYSVTRPLAFAQCLAVVLLILTDRALAGSTGAPVTTHAAVKATGSTIHLTTKVPCTPNSANALMPGVPIPPTPVPSTVMTTMEPTTTTMSELQQWLNKAGSAEKALEDVAKSLSASGLASGAPGGTAAATTVRVTTAAAIKAPAKSLSLSVMSDAMDKLAGVGARIREPPAPAPGVTEAANKVAHAAAAAVAATASALKKKKAATKVAQPAKKIPKLSPKSVQAAAPVVAASHPEAEQASAGRSKVIGASVGGSIAGLAVVAAVVAAAVLGKKKRNKGSSEVVNFADVKNYGGLEDVE